LSAFSKQRGQLKRPDHADLRYKCRTYARLLQQLKVWLWMKYNIFSKFSFANLYLLSLLLFILLNMQILDKNCLAPLKKAYCCSLNLLLRREVWDYKYLLLLLLFLFLYHFGGKLWLELEHFMNCEVTTIHVEIFTVVITCKRSRFSNKNCKTLLAWSFMKCLGHGKKNPM